MSGKIHEGMGGDALVIEDGGVVILKSGGRIALESGGKVEEASGGGVLGRAVLTTYAADIGTEGASYVVCPFAGTIVGLGAVNHGDNAGTKTVLAASIGAAAVTHPDWEIAASGTAGTGVSVVPTAANTVAAGDVIKIAYDGGSSNVTPATFTITIPRTS